MALTFNSDQLKKLSSDYLFYPEEIAKQEEAVVFINQEVENLKKKDEENTVFFKNYLNIINQYHKELANIVGRQRSNYDEGLIDPAARSEADVPHYPGTLPSNYWKPFFPKLVESNNGLPIQDLPQYERERLPIVISKIDLFTNGFTSGAVTTSSVSGMTGNVLPVGVSSIQVSDFIIVNQGANSFYGQVSGTSTVSGVTDLQISFIHPTSPGVILSGATVKNFWPGFNNTEREVMLSSDYQNVMDHLSQFIQSRVSEWKSFLSNQLDAINLNDAVGEEKKEVSDAKSNVSRALQTIKNFEDAPISGVGIGRFSNSLIVPLRAEAVTRDRDIGVRFGQIERRLGSVTQDPESGDFTGEGNYFNLIKWINLRVHRVMGSLRLYYNTLRAVDTIGSRVKIFKDKQAEIESVYVIKKATAGGANDNKLVLEDVKSLSVGDQVKIIANDLDILNATIESITDKQLNFDRIIPDTYTVDKVLRILKNK